MTGNSNRGWIRKAGLASSAGLTLVISTMIGYAAGNWLDEKLHTTPWLMLALTLIGTAAGFIEVFRIVAELSEDDGKED